MTGSPNMPSPWPKYLLFDRALPLSQSALDGAAGPQGMTLAERLAAALITELEGQGRGAAAALVRQAVTTPQGHQ